MHSEALALPTSLECNCTALRHSTSFRVFASLLRFDVALFPIPLWVVTWRAAFAESTRPVPPLPWLTATDGRCTRQIPTDVLPKS